MTTFDLSKVIYDTNTNEQWYREDKKNLDAEGKPTKVDMTAKDIILQAFKVRLQSDNLSEEDVNFNRKICKKLSKSENVAEIALKSKAVNAIKSRIRAVSFPYDVVMQIIDIFDGEPTQAELDEV